MITRQRGLNRAGWYLDKNTSKSKIIRIQGDKKTVHAVPRAIQQISFAKGFNKNGRTIVMLLVSER